LDKLEMARQLGDGYDAPLVNVIYEKLNRTVAIAKANTRKESNTSHRMVMPKIYYAEVLLLCLSSSSKFVSDC